MNRKDTSHWLNRVLLTAMGGLMAAAPQALAEGNVPDQGRRLHGTARERLERTNLSLSSALQGNVFLSGVTLEHGQLRAQGMSGNAFVNVKFTQTIANELVTFRITAAQRHKNRYGSPIALPSPYTWEYKVEYSSPSLGTGPLCPGAAEDRWALAIPGNWVGGDHTKTSYRFAFACLPRVAAPTLGGVAAKCVELGYPPWQNNDPRIDGTSLPLTQEDALRHHVVCTSLASADYCGEATPNTLNGTPIKLFHTGNVPVETDTSGQVRIGAGPVHQDYLFEAAWALVDVKTGQFIPSSSSQAELVRAQAVCLTKKRWSSLPLRGTCIADTDDDELTSRLPDPRLPDSGKYCEDYTRDELVQLGAVLFSYSKFLDVGLYRFKHTPTQQYLTTSHIILNPGLTGTEPLEERYQRLYQPDPAIFPDAGNYQLADKGLPDSYEGPLFRPSAPLHIFEGTNVSRLLRYRKAGSGVDGPASFFTAVEGNSVAIPADFILDGIEGYLYTAVTPPASGPGLLLFQNSAQGSFLTTGNKDLVPETPSEFYAPLTQDPMGYLPSLEFYAAPVPY
ncbi:ADYC domain-containing protein [Stigmatella erecta]|uniref:ADYC domain-containing protein n=1 Tax=Stigmatella erecta TaxID=83460 RepID=A0A1I0INT8_9BACT|nr:ADYC domain-containing protein [Stigmatella erecta]SET98816.1 hypothetical protein SAMN05443639_106185 [Stigmatella erecta]